MRIKFIQSLIAVVVSCFVLTSCVPSHTASSLPSDTIGIIAAMKLEAEGLKSQMKDVQTQTTSGIDFHTGTLCDKNVVLAVCGVGKVNAAMCTQAMILKYNPCEIINTGVAGGLCSDLKVGDVVIAEKVGQHDYDNAQNGNHLPGDMNFEIGLSTIPCAQSIKDRLVKSAEKVGGINYKVGTIVSGDQFVKANDRKKYLSDTLEASAVEMECGSIGHVCFLNHVDFGVIRSISDAGDDKANDTYLNWRHQAADKSIKVTLEFLKES